MRRREGLKNKRRGLNGSVLRKKGVKGRPRKNKGGGVGAENNGR